MPHCKKCNREIPRGTKKSDHVCDTVKLNNGHIVQRSRVEAGGDLHEAVVAGELKVMERAIAEPLRAIGEKFKRRKRDPATGAVLLED